MPREPYEPRHFRTLFLSDLHLGTRGCQAHLVLDFLDHHSADTIYLVGDIIDGWQLRKSWYWPQSHTDVVQKLLAKREDEGSRVIYLPGNHDEFLRDYTGIHFGIVEVIDETTHTLADGRKLMVLHGDQFDIVVRYAPWLAVLGSGAYNFALGVNTLLNRVRRRMGFDYWSLSAWAKEKVKNAMSHISQFEDALASEARRRGVDGVVCGHIHHARIEDEKGFVYVNSGDWVESCTAIAEHPDGKLEMIRWTVKRGDRATDPGPDGEDLAEDAVADAAE